MVTYLGSLVQLCCGEGGTLQTNTTGMCGECSQWMDHTGFAPAHGVCACLGLHSQAPGCSSGALSKVGPAFCTLPRSNLLRFRFLGTPQRHRFSWVCVLCPSWVSSSGNHVLGERTVPGGLCFLITSLVPAAWFPRCTVRAQT